METVWSRRPIAPGGPALTLAVLLAAAGLFLLGAVQFTGNNRTPRLRWEQKIKLGLQTGTIAWAGISIAVWLIGWAEQFSLALRAVH